MFNYARMAIEVVFDLLNAVGGGLLMIFIIASIVDRKRAAQPTDFQKLRRESKEFCHKIVNFSEDLELQNHQLQEKVKELQGCNQRLEDENQELKKRRSGG